MKTSVLSPSHFILALLYGYVLSTFALINEYEPLKQSRTVSSSLIRCQQNYKEKSFVFTRVQHHSSSTPSADMFVAFYILLEIKKRNRVSE